MATRYNSVKVVCPFYKDDGQNRIRCEGITAGSSTEVKFQTDEKKRTYKEKHCDSDCKKCLIHQMLYRKYEKK